MKMRWSQQNPGDSSTLFSPTCPRSAFPAAAVVVSEHPCVTLDEWWLATVEGHERKIAVAGSFKRNQVDMDFAAAPVAKRHEPYVLETENGTVVLISGSFNIGQTLENGFTIEACEKFSLGFPHWWENWNVLCPKMMSSQTGSQPRSSRTSDTSTGDTFPDSSRLPNGARRFEEYNCDDDTPTVEKSAASNHDGKKVRNMETDLIGTSTLKEGSYDGIDRNIPSTSMVECANDEGNAGIDNASRINNGREKTHAASLKRGGYLNKPQRVPGEDTATLAYSDSEVHSSEKGKQPVGTSRKQRYALKRLQRATRSPNVISPTPYGNLSPLACGWAKSLTMSTPECLKLKKTRSGRVVVPALDRACQNIVYAPDGSISAIIGLDSPPPLKGSMSKNYARKKQRTN